MISNVVYNKLDKIIDIVLFYYSKHSLFKKKPNYNINESIRILINIKNIHIFGKNYKGIHIPYGITFNSIVYYDTCNQ